MLQDLWVPVESVAPGDHVVHEGAFFRVIESRFCIKEGGDPDPSLWYLKLTSGGITVCDDDKKAEVYIPRFNTLDGKPPHIRVRPCGSSSHLEE